MTGSEAHVLAFLRWLRNHPATLGMNQLQLIDWIEKVVRDPGRNVAPAWFDDFMAEEKRREECKP